LVRESRRTVSESVRTCALAVAKNGHRPQKGAVTVLFVAGPLAYYHNIVKAANALIFHIMLKISPLTALATDLCGWPNFMVGVSPKLAERTMRSVTGSIAVATQTQQLTGGFMDDARLRLKALEGIVAPGLKKHVHGHAS